jgi:D-alanine-D-alanine ligase
MRRDNRVRVAVIGGGASCEHDVSLASAAAICRALDPGRYDVVSLTIDPRGVWHDRGGRPIGLTGATHVLRSCDVAIPAVHGPHGEDGTLAALCELAGLPYVGSGVGAGAIAMDKWVTKLVAEAVGVATVPGVLLTAATAPAYTWTHPVVVKPVTAGSSHGVGLVREPAELGPALDAALAVDRRILVEDLVVGREIDIAVLGWCHRRSRSWSTASSTTRPSTTAAPTSGCPPRCSSRRPKSSPTRRSRSSTRWAAPASRGWTSS